MSSPKVVNVSPFFVVMSSFVVIFSRRYRPKPLTRHDSRSEEIFLSSFVVICRHFYRMPLGRRAGGAHAYATPPGRRTPVEYLMRKADAAVPGRRIPARNVNIRHHL
jgi:hypothetical protein